MPSTSGTVYESNEGGGYDIKSFSPWWAFNSGTFNNHWVNISRKFNGISSFVPEEWMDR